MQELRHGLVPEPLRKGHGQDMSATENLLSATAQGINAALVPAIFLYLLWKREWSWTGLVLGLCIGLAAWFQVDFAVGQLLIRPVEIAGSFNVSEPSPGELAWLMFRALLYLGAMVSCLRGPKQIRTVLIVAVSLSILFTTAIPVVRWIVGLDSLDIIPIREFDTPDWADLIAAIIGGIIPAAVAVPWSIYRLSNVRQNLMSPVLDRFALISGIAIVAFTLVSSAMMSGGFRAAGPFAGEPIAAAQSGARSGFPPIVILILLVGTGLAAFWALRRAFIEPAIALIEALRGSKSPETLTRLPAIWQPLFRSIESDRQQASDHLKALEETRAQLAALFEHAPVAMALSDMDGKHQLTNRAVEELYGLPAAELREKPGSWLFERFENFSEFAPHWEALIKTGKPMRIETVFKPENRDEPRNLDLIVFPVRAADGTIKQIGSLAIDVTARQEAERALAEREAMLAGLFDHAPVAITVFSRERRMVAANRAATGAYGMTRVGKRSLPVERFRPFWPEFDRFVELGLSVFETGEPQQFSIAFDPPRGAPQEIKEAIYFPIYSSTGEVAQVGLCMMDVTEQKRAEAALAEREAQLTSLLDHIPAGINVFDLNSNLVLVNKAAAERNKLVDPGLPGVESSQLSDRWPEFEKLTATALAVLQTKAPQRLTTLYQRPGEPEPILCDVVSFPILNAAGEVHQVGLFMLDVTEQQQREQELARSRGTLQAFFENIPAMTFIIGPDRKYVSANSYAIDSYGFEFLSPENLIGKSDLTGTPDHWHPVIAEAHRTVMEDGKPHEVETSIDMPGGTLTLYVSRFPIRSAEGEVTHVGGLIFDRTAERRASDQVAATREALHQSEKLAALGQLLAGVAHELNNPLTVVVGRSAILEEKLKETPHGKAIADLREAADRCNRIVRTFLAMARQSAPRRAAVQINDAIEAALDMTAYGLRSSGIELVRKFDENLPEVEGDEDQLVQVFTNLLINARHALEEHRPEGGKVTIATRAKGGKLQVEIADNGPGVPAELVSRIFEPFFTTKAVGDGTGMGLAMSRGMIEEHGGKLLYSDAKGGGGVFTVELPIVAALASAKPESDIEQPLGKARGRVLVIDDEPSIRGLLVEILEGIELDCTECGDGAAALELLDQQSFDLVFCDVRMPVMDGVRFRQHLAETHPALLDRLVFISGDVLQRGNARRAEIAGHAFIEKPFNPAEVRQLALSLLDAEGAAP
jgi:PAS domain S-box-containing protein